MKRKVRTTKRIFTFLLVFLLSINSFAAVVSDNDGSAFITKAEFDSLRNSFQSQIDSYNKSIDSKIDGAIAQYLAGIRVEDKPEVKVNFHSKYLIPYGIQYGYRSEFPSNPSTIFDNYDSKGKVGTGTLYNNIVSIFHSEQLSTTYQTSGYVDVRDGVTTADYAYNVEFASGTSTNYQNIQDAFLTYGINIYEGYASYGSTNKTHTITTGKIGGTGGHYRYACAVPMSTESYFDPDHPFKTGLYVQSSLAQNVQLTVSFPSTKTEKPNDNYWYMGNWDTKNAKPTTESAWNSRTKKLKLSEWGDLCDSNFFNENGTIANITSKLPNWKLTSSDRGNFLWNPFFYSQTIQWDKGYIVLKVKHEAGKKSYSNYSIFGNVSTDKSCEFVRCNIHESDFIVKDFYGNGSFSEYVFYDSRTNSQDSGVLGFNVGNVAWITESPNGANSTAAQALKQTGWTITLEIYTKDNELVKRQVIYDSAGNSNLTGLT